MRSRENIRALTISALAAIGLGYLAFGGISSEEPESDRLCNPLTAVTFSGPAKTEPLSLTNTGGCVAIQEIGGDNTIDVVETGDVLRAICAIKETFVVKLPMDGSEAVGRIIVSSEIAHDMAAANALPDCNLRNTV